MSCKTEEKLIDAELIESAAKFQDESKLVRETPMLCDVGYLFDLPANISLYLKLETMQTNGF